MLSAGLAVSLLLATYGNEGPREEKLRGALIAQAAATNGESALQRELELLTARLQEHRAGKTSALVLIGIGAGGVLAAGATVFALAVIGRLSSGLSVLVTIGLLTAGIGVAVIVVGLVSLAQSSSARVETEAQLDALRRRVRPELARF